MFSSLKRFFKPQTSPNFASTFGGLWVDRSDADPVLKKKVRVGDVSPALAGHIGHFKDEGYVVFPGAVLPAVVDRLNRVIAQAYRNGDSRVRYHTDGAEHHILTAGTDPHGKRIVESHAVLPEARDIFTSPDLQAFLSAVFEDTPVLTQSLLFTNGSEQPFHQDPAFVDYEQPRHMAAAWVALEDLEEGCGYLRYLAKSHLLPDYVFSTGRRDSKGAAPDEVERYLEWLLDEAEKRGLKEHTFEARKGDVFIWHADLVHGGAPVTNPHATRKSLVGHFCPQSVLPRYPSGADRKPHDGFLYSSYLYDLGERNDGSLIPI